MLNGENKNNIAVGSNMEAALQSITGFYWQRQAELTEATAVQLNAAPEQNLVLLLVFLTPHSSTLLSVYTVLSHISLVVYLLCPSLHPPYSLLYALCAEPRFLFWLYIVLFHTSVRLRDGERSKEQGNSREMLHM